jgi:hypothetical protein
MYLGTLLIGVGLVMLAMQLGLLPSGVGNLLWPVLAIFVGVWLLMSKREGNFFGPSGK